MQGDAEAEAQRSARADKRGVFAASALPDRCRVGFVAAGLSVVLTDRTRE